MEIFLLMSSAAEILDDLLAKSALSEADLAAQAGYEHRTLKRVRSGEIPFSDRMKRNLARVAELANRTRGPIPTLEHLSPRERLASTLAAKGMTITQLAKLTKYSAGVLRGVIEGGGRISEDMARAIVREVPELTVEELLAGSDTPRVMDESGITGTAGATPTITIPGKGKTRLVSLLSWAAAGQLATIDALDESFTGDGVASSVPGRAFGVEVRGDSMHPEINPGDYAIVRADAQATPGNVVLVRTIHGDVLCKRYQTRDGGRLVILSSVNRSYEPIEIPASDIAWIYPVKQVIRNY